MAGDQDSNELAIQRERTKQVRARSEAIKRSVLIAALAIIFVIVLFTFHDDKQFIQWIGGAEVAIGVIALLWLL